MNIKDQDEREKFGVMLGSLAEIFPRDINATMIRVYMQDLEDYPIKSVEEGIKYIRKYRLRREGYPTPGDIVEAIRTTCTYRQPDNSDLIEYQEPEISDEEKKYRSVFLKFTMLCFVAKKYEFNKQELLRFIDNIYDPDRTFKYKLKAERIVENLTKAEALSLVEKYLNENIFTNYEENIKEHRNG